MGGDPKIEGCHPQRGSLWVPPPHAALTPGGAVGCGAPSHPMGAEAALLGCGVTVGSPLCESQPHPNPIPIPIPIPIPNPNPTLTPNLTLPQRPHGAAGTADTQQ